MRQFRNQFRFARSFDTITLGRPAGVNRRSSSRVAKATSSIERTVPSDASFTAKATVLTTDGRPPGLASALGIGRKFKNNITLTISAAANHVSRIWKESGSLVKRL